MEENSDSPPMVSVEVKLNLGGRQLEGRIDVPTEPIDQRGLLPIVQALANQVVDAAVQTEAQAGRPISCRAGCGACCRQMVPISETEAYHIRDLIRAMPQPRQTAVLARFQAAHQRLQATGLLERLVQSRQTSFEENRHVALDYFRLGIPCPFLEDESCSIYPDRPISCREYLVTSPPQYCSRPDEDTVRGVKMPVKLWTALAALDPVKEGDNGVRWVPLILAPQWADAHPPQPPRPGLELVRELFQRLTGKQTPEPPVQPGR